MGKVGGKLWKSFGGELSRVKDDREYRSGPDALVKSANGRIGRMAESLNTSKVRADLRKESFREELKEILI